MQTSVSVIHQQEPMSFQNSEAPHKKREQNASKHRQMRPGYTGHEENRGQIPTCKT